MKNVLLAASEAVPFIKTGGLADVIGSLPKYFDKKEYDVRVILPKYACMDRSLLRGLKKSAETEVCLNWRKQYAGVYQGEADGIIYYFIDNEYYFSGPAPYDQIYLDAEKFAYFSKAVLTVLPLLDFCPDIIHCNDWQTGLIPVFLKTQFQADSFYRHIKTIFTIHNMRYQGRWYMDAYRDITGLPDSCFTMDTMECYGQANPFKGGIVESDIITTVSESYAKEIQERDGGEGLDGLMRARGCRLFGIINGLDYSVYNPETDPLIAANFGVGNWQDQKKLNKKALQEQMELGVRDDVFLIGLVSRMTDQKGFDLVAQKIEEIMKLQDVQLVLQGSGEEKYESMLVSFSKKYQHRMAVRIGYSEELAHRIYASADTFLMPSMFEPCGLSQLISLRYGTVPIVRETGGLKDTIKPYQEGNQTGTGFSFTAYHADDMMSVIRCAYHVYRNHREQWNDVVLRGMQQDYSWIKSAEKYAELYDMLVQIKSTEIEQEKVRQEAEKAAVLLRKKVDETLSQKSMGKKVEDSKPKKTAGKNKRSTSKKRK